PSQAKNNISQAASNPDFYIINNTCFFHHQSVNQLNIFQGYFTLARQKLSGMQDTLSGRAVVNAGTCFPKVI
ncbi:TPA: hypothetical protein ACV7ZZ_005204, partial [Escherichia coli]